jgi:hypothetical protein
MGASVRFEGQQPTERTVRRNIILMRFDPFVLSGGRRNFGSITTMQAQRFDVLVDDEFAADEVRRLVAANVISA